MHLRLLKGSRDSEDLGVFETAAGQAAGEPVRFRRLLAGEPVPSVVGIDLAGGARLVRDPSFPIRITVQFYKATSNGVVTEADLDGIERSIASAYAHADYVGSLVLPEGDRARPTAWQKVPGEWFPW